MPKIIDLSLFQAAMGVTQHPWKTLQGKFDEAHNAFQSSIMANQQSDAALGAALSPMIGSLTSLASKGVQDLIAGIGASPVGGTVGIQQTQSGAYQSGTGAPLVGGQGLRAAMGMDVNLLPWQQ